MGEVGGLSEVSIAIKAQNPDLETAWRTITWWERTCNYWREQATARAGAPDALAKVWDEGHRDACDDHLCAEMGHLDRNPYRAPGAAPDALRGPLPIAVERGVECFHGSPRGCISYRCGSNCSQRFDRMHPCPACLIAEIHDLRAALGERPTDGAGT